MILTIIFCVVLQTCFCKEKTTHKMAAATVRPKMNRNVYKKTAELIYFINKMNNHNDYEKKHLKVLDMDYFGIRNNQEMALKPLMKLMQKNYDASKIQKKEPDVRVHFISNPEVLDIFQKFLKEKELKNSFEDNDSYSSKKFKEILRSVRRQAVFRIDDPTSEEKLVPEEQSFEAMQRSIGDNTELTDKLNEETAGIHNSRKKETESKEDMDTWDIITKKYDWDKENKDIEGNKDISDNWEQKEDKKSKLNNMGQDKKKYIEKKKDTNKLDYWEPNDKLDDKENDENKNIDKFDDWGQKNNKKDSHWEDTRKDKHNDNWGKKKKETDETWDDLSKANKAKDELKRNEPRHKRKGSEIKEKKQDKWDKEDNRDNWDKTTRQRKTTKRQNQDNFRINAWDHFVPKVQNKPKRYGFDRNIPAGAFGRTSIPFVGKKSVYEET